ncbi:cytochrome P450 CYP82D47-like [Momordica charantia]|uniref:Cytochrome P450 CYP82D47-like n=1 Tax=Momordica charantia TaxID=3673 RepID=A0A6J1BSL4_MOMCH|nr:cytochrome P450 CYP82D47-like [Momordica charantia]XP_022132490.1 cytochrome P450 CYP82D47-like [Momordica charantia]
MEPNAQFNWLSLITTLLAGVIAINFFRFLLKTFTASKGLKPPTVAGGWPLIGHLPLLAGPELPHIKLSALANEYGPIFSIQLGIRKAVVINSWEAAKQCFTTHDVAISSRPNILASKILGYNYAMFAFGPYDSYWRKMRKTTNLHLLSNRRLELLRNVRESEVNQAIKELYTAWKERRDEQGQVLVEMKQWVGDLTMNLILGVVAGKRYFGAAAMVAEAEARACHRATKEFLRLMGLFTLGDVVPYLGWLDVGGHVKAMKRTSKELDHMLTRWLEEHRKDRASGRSKEDKDFMDVMLSVLEEETANVVSDSAHSFDDDTIIKATCLTMVLGGSDTTVVVVTWALSLLLNNRPALRKVQQELDARIGRDRELNESDIGKLVYFQAVVKETMRLYGVVGLFVRETSEDFAIDGFHIEKGTWLFMNLWKIHRDERVWGEPLEFKPERFLTTHKDFDVKGQQFELIPFGEEEEHALECPWDSKWYNLFWVDCFKLLIYRQWRTLPSI